MPAPAEIFAAPKDGEGDCLQDLAAEFRIRRRNECRQPKSSSKGPFPLKGAAVLLRPPGPCSFYRREG